MKKKILSYISLLFLLSPIVIPTMTVVAKENPIQDSTFQESIEQPSVAQENAEQSSSEVLAVGEENDKVQSSENDTNAQSSVENTEKESNAPPANRAETNSGLKPPIEVDINNPPDDVGLGIVGIDNPKNVPTDVKVSSDGSFKLNNNLENAKENYYPEDFNYAKNVKYFDMNQNYGVTSVEFPNKKKIPSSVEINYPEIGKYRNRPVGVKMMFSDIKYDNTAWTFESAVLQISHNFRSGYAYWNIDSMEIQYDFYYADTNEPLVFGEYDKATLNFESLNVGEYVAPLNEENDNYISNNSYIKTEPNNSRPGITSLIGTSDDFEDKRGSTTMYKASVSNVLTTSNRYIVGATNKDRWVVWNYNELVPFFSPGVVTINKLDSKNGNKLSGAVFSLKDAGGSVILEDITTDENGVAKIESLKYGNYTLIETKAPDGYDINIKPIEFEVNAENAKTLTIDVENSLTPGSVLLEKTDGKTAELLEGAVFELQDETGKVLQKGLETDSSGKLAIDGLSPGNYQLVETKAPVGYELDSKPVSFTIEKGQTTAVKVSKENNLTPGSVLLEKTDGKTAELLEGAVFELQDETGKVLQKGLETDSSGKLAIDGLSPGNYQLVETKAPVGYELDSK
ncbi:MSCRAMM family protein, partial [Carnobacterium divergens]|uniref:MSCRAMM family protein n=1 Tax=Carnobacterium divergens TaxID=2748 RepID=UPI00288E9EAB